MNPYFDEEFGIMKSGRYGNVAGIYTGTEKYDTWKWHEYRHILPVEERPGEVAKWLISHERR